MIDEIMVVVIKISGKPLPKDLATAERILRSTRKNTSRSNPSMAIDYE